MNKLKQLIISIITISIIIFAYKYFFIDKKIQNNYESPKINFSGGLIQINK